MSVQYARSIERGLSWSELTVVSAEAGGVGPVKTIMVLGSKKMSESGRRKTRPRAKKRCKKG